MMLAATIDLLDEPDINRAAERARVDRTSTLRDDRDVPRDVLVDDLSRTGFRFSSPVHLPVGTAVRLGLAGAGSAAARVVRQDGDDHGCAFHTPLTPEQLRSAFTSAGVLPVAAAADARDPSTVDRWPRIVRLAIFVAGGLLAWSAVVALMSALG